MDDVLQIVCEKIEVVDEEEVEVHLVEVSEYSEMIDEMYIITIIVVDDDEVELDEAEIDYIILIIDDIDDYEYRVIQNEQQNAMLDEDDELQVVDVDVDDYDVIDDEMDDIIDDADVMPQLVEVDEVDDVMLDDVDDVDWQLYVIHQNVDIILYDEIDMNVIDIAYIVLILLEVFYNITQIKEISLTWQYEDDEVVVIGLDDDEVQYAVE